MMYLQPDDHELEYLSELLEEFSVDVSLKPADALRLIYDRYQVFERNFHKIASDLNRTIQRRGARPADFYHPLCLAIHAYLYKNILSNAGSFRKSTDRNFGIVEFGGLTASGHKSRFRGAAPDQIEAELLECFALLDGDDPISASIFFYLSFHSSTLSMTPMVGSPG